ncbi:MAG TPA: P1 family peptidase [Gemmatimonadaceae bacterium]|nr:P1 family peptidase [Gemmatimonadaceae bacterium]
MSDADSRGIEIDPVADFTALGIAVGHATDEDGATGCTVVRPVEGAMRGAAAVVGRATGTRELLPLTTHHLVDRVAAILLTGGSAYGLDAAAGVMRWMEERGRGFEVGAGVVPIVPAAVIFDLAPLGRFDARPTPEMAYFAADTARSAEIEEGSVGAGTGATVGKAAGVERAMKGGFGCAVARCGSVVAGAVVVVNALGDVRDEHGRILAGARDDDGFADSAALLAKGQPAEFADAQSPVAPTNTTLAVVAVNAAFSRVDLATVAASATSALHRRITPVGTAFDGDIVFALAPLDGPAGDPVAAGVVATAALETAIEHAVLRARGRDGIPGLAGNAPTDGR